MPECFEVVLSMLFARHWLFVFRRLVPLNHPSVVVPTTWKDSDKLPRESVLPFDSRISPCVVPRWPVIPTRP